MHASHGRTARLASHHARRRAEAVVPRASEAISDAESERSSDLHQLRLTKIEALYNTNRTSLRARGAVVDELETYLKTSLWTEETLKELIAIEPPDPRRIIAVEILAPAIEIGDRQHRVHAHFIVRILHAARVKLGEMQKRMQNHFRTQSVFNTGFVSLRLLDGRAENYALKEKMISIE